MEIRVKNEKGLTLVELLAVIVILAIVAAIAIPAINNVIDNLRYKALKADAINVIHAAQFYFMEHKTADQWQIVEVEKLVSDGYLDSAGKILEADKEGQSANVQFLSRAPITSMRMRFITAMENILILIMPPYSILQMIFVRAARELVANV